MTENIALIGFTVLMMVIIVYTPNLFRLRVRILRKFNWDRLADWHERHMNKLILLARGIIIVILVILYSIEMGLLNC